MEPMNESTKNELFLKIVRGGLKNSGVSGLTCRLTTSYNKPERYATMDKDNAISFANRELFADLLTDLIRNGARQLIAVAVEVEVNELLAKYDGILRFSGGSLAKLAYHQSD